MDKDITRAALQKAGDQIEEKVINRLLGHSGFGDISLQDAKWLAHSVRRIAFDEAAKELGIG